MSAAPIKVLVIDDEFPMRALLRKKLKPQGYEVIEAAFSRLIGSFGSSIRFFSEGT